MVALLVMAYGTPDRPSELPAYYTHIRHGRPPSAQQLAELRARYEAIGGLSPLGRLTRVQAGKLAQVLEARFPDIDVTAEVGFKHIRPFIEDAIAALRARDVTAAIPIVMAPHDSAAGVQPYLQRAADTAGALGVTLLPAVSGWYRQPGFVRLWAAHLRVTLGTLSAEELARTRVVFSAHSLPLEALKDDPYAAQVRESADLIAAAAGVRDYTVAWQSAGRTSQAWLGPDIRDVVRRTWADGKHRTFVVCPVGFVCDHLEVLYDDDIECRTLIEALGGRYLRPPMPGVEDAFIACLGDAVAEVLQQREFVEA